MASARAGRASLGLAVTLAWTVSAQAAPVVAAAEVDALFSAWTDATPGCAVGVSRDGEILLERAYGMADLEHDVQNAPDTIFEAGSVSKQITAAAVLLLAREGKLSLDDPVRKHLPELPDYGATITLRQMLNHTSGLRDWGSVADVAGWPRSTRVYTHAHVLDIASRQSALNFAPGSNWSYTNTGYNLAVVVVARVSGESFADFTRKRIFEPLGMTRTSWRDDHKRIVKGRAIAYEESVGSYRTDMPFEDVHGNGGLLTTVGDLLRWNRNFLSPVVGDEAFVQALQTPGRLNDGRAHRYAFGLRVGEYKGLREISHSGTTASYRAYLARYPDQHLSVAVLCNAGNSTPRPSLHAVADLYLADALKPPPAPTPAAVPTAELDSLTGMYRNTGTGTAATVTRDGDALRIDGGPPLVALSPRRFADGEGLVVEFAGDGKGRVDFGDGTSVDVERVEPASPAAADLEALAGNYSSDDAEVTLTVQLRDGFLEIARRPDGRFRLTPLYADAFDSELGTIIFHRNESGRPVEFSVVRERVWDLRFRRLPE
jgi:CubicO group peptidase (beta-lactamase class C family)